MSDVLAYIFPGLMIMWIFFIVQQPMSDVYREKDMRTLPRLLASTVTVWEYLISKILRCILIGMLACFLLLLVTWMFFGVKWGNPGWQALVIGCASLAITGFLTLIYGLAGSRERADALTPAIVLSMSMFGGSMFPLDEMPPFMRNFTGGTINYWAITGIRNTMEGKPAGEILWPCAILAAAGLVLVGIGFRLIKGRLEGGELE